MSERNGDKSRFGRERRKKIERRRRNRELLKSLSAAKPPTANQPKSAG